MWLGLVAAVISLGWNSWAAYHDPYMGPRLKKFFRGLGRAFPIAWGWIKERADNVLTSRRAEREQYMAVVRAYGKEIARLNREIKRLRDVNAKMNSQIKAIETYKGRKSSMDGLVKKLQREYEAETHSVHSVEKAEPIYTYMLSPGERVVPLRAIEPKPAMCVECDVPLETEEAFHMHLPNGKPATFPKARAPREVRALPQLTGPDMPVTVKGVDKHDPDVITESHEETMARLRKRVEENSMVHVEPEPPTHAQYGDAWLPTIEPERHVCHGCAKRIDHEGMCDFCTATWPRAI